MLKRKMIGLMVLVLSAALAFAACSDDGGSNNEPANNGGTDAGDTGGGDEDTGGAPGCTSDEDCGAGMTCDQSAARCVIAPSGCELQGEDRPARCDEAPENAAFGPGSVVTSLQIAGTGADEEPTCCFDYNSGQSHTDADPAVDNALGVNLEGLYLEDLNDSLAESISGGDLILAFEHDGLTAMDGGETYGLNFWLGELQDELFVSSGPGVDCSEIDDPCENAACASTSVCVVPGEVCDSEVDEDGDGDISCLDEDCINTAACDGAEICDSGADDDEDGDVDCADADCAGTATCVTAGETCDSGADEDGDGAIDCADPDCFGVVSCQHDNALLVDPSSLDEGTYPQARVQNATIDNGLLTAGPGTVRISVDLLGTQISLAISDARIEADVDTSMSTIDDGIWLSDGKLGGVIRVTDILEAVNDYADTSCGCLGLGDEPLIHYNPENIGCFADDIDDPEDGMYQGKQCGCAEVDANACDNSCGDIAGFCGLAYSIIPGLSDVDTDLDGEPDAVSVGATFETVGANFTGIAEE